MKAARDPKTWCQEHQALLRGYMKAADSFLHDYDSMVASERDRLRALLVKDQARLTALVKKMELYDVRPRPAHWSHVLTTV